MSIYRCKISDVSRDGLRDLLMGWDTIHAAGPQQAAVTYCESHIPKDFVTEGDVLIVHSQHWRGGGEQRFTTPVEEHRMRVKTVFTTEQ